MLEFQHLLQVLVLADGPLAHTQLQCEVPHHPHKAGEEAHELAVLGLIFSFSAVVAILVPVPHLDQLRQLCHQPAPLRSTTLPKFCVPSRILCTPQIFLSSSVRCVLPHGAHLRPEYCTPS